MCAVLACGPVRLGCGGCLTTLVVWGIIAGALASVGWLATGILAEAELAPVLSGDEALARQKLSQVLATARNRPQQSRLVSFTEGELNALLSRRLPELAEFPLTRVQLRLPGLGTAEVAGRVPVAALLGEQPFNRLVNLLPAGWQQTPVWVRFRVRASVEPMDDGRRRYMRLRIERFWLGRRRLPAILPRLMLSPATLRVLHFRLPDSVAEVSLQAGRIDVVRVEKP